MGVLFRRQGLLLALGLLSITGSLLAQAADPVIYWARMLSGKPREVWLCGEGLWVGSEYPNQPSGQNSVYAAIDGKPLRWDRMQGANDNDANRGLRFLQRFIVPSDVITGTAIDWTRNDGRTSSASIAVAKEVPVVERRDCGPMETIDRPLLIPPGETRNLGGKCLVPGPSFVAGEDRALVVLSPWSRLCNASVFVPESAPEIQAAVKLKGLGCQVDGVSIENRQRGWYGLHMGDASGAYVRNVEISAYRCVESSPNAWNAGNTFYRVDCTCPRGRSDGQIGRGMGGLQTLAVWCTWHDIDRGPVISNWGAPLERSAWFECSQTRTGSSVGASEGFLWEAMDCVQGPATLAGLSIRMRKPADVGPAQERQIKPGYFAANLGTQRIARIKASTIDADGYTIDLEAAIGPPGAANVRIGNLVHQNAVIRFRASQGRSGLWWFGASADNRAVGCEFEGLSEAGIETLTGSRGGKESAFSWRLDTAWSKVNPSSAFPLLLHRQVSNQ